MERYQSITEAFAPKKFQQVLRVIAKAIQHKTGLKVSYTSAEKLYLGSDQLYVRTFNVGPMIIVRFGFSSPYGEVIEKVSVLKPNIKYEVLVGDVPLMPVIDDLVSAIIDGTKSNQSTFGITKPEKEVAILTPEEQAFEKEYEELVILESDLNARLELLRDAVRDIHSLHNGLLVSGNPGIGKCFRSSEAFKIRVTPDFLNFLKEKNYKFVEK